MSGKEPWVAPLLASQARNTRLDHAVPDALATRAFDVLRQALAGAGLRRRRELASRGQDFAGLGDAVGAAVSGEQRVVRVHQQPYLHATLREHSRAAAAAQPQAPRRLRPLQRQLRRGRQRRDWWCGGRTRRRRRRPRSHWERGKRGLLAQRWRLMLPILRLRLLLRLLLQKMQLVLHLLLEQKLLLLLLLDTLLLDVPLLEQRLLLLQMLLLKQLLLHARLPQHDNVLLPMLRLLRPLQKLLLWLWLLRRWRRHRRLLLLVRLLLTGFLPEPSLLLQLVHLSVAHRG
mmetsp:Transcript_128/g.385  ORF Transcript_128/g.385 Transcript_128/m.385 type:complete len:288 (-) Transcript_128:158-1021(-)